MRLALARALFARLVSRLSLCWFTFLAICAAGGWGTAWGSSQTVRVGSF